MPTKSLPNPVVRMPRGTAVTARVGADASRLRVAALVIALAFACAAAGAAAAVMRLAF